MTGDVSLWRVDDVSCRRSEFLRVDFRLSFGVELRQAVDGRPRPPTRPLRGGALAMLSRHFKEIHRQCDHKDAAGLATVFFCSA